MQTGMLTARQLKGRSQAVIALPVTRRPSYSRSVRVRALGCCCRADARLRHKNPPLDNLPLSAGVFYACLLCRQQQLSLSRLLIDSAARSLFRIRSGFPRAPFTHRPRYARSISYSLARCPHRGRRPLLITQTVPPRKHLLPGGTFLRNLRLSPVRAPSLPFISSPHSSFSPVSCGFSRSGRGIR